MFPWLDGLFTVLVDRSPEELLGAIILGLVFSAAMAPVAVWVGRSKRDQIPRMTGLMLVLAVVSMVVSGTFVQAQHDSERYDREPESNGHPMIIYPPDYFGMIAVLDINEDGLVDLQELRGAAEALGTENRLPRFGRGFGQFGRHRASDSGSADSRSGPRRDDHFGQPHTGLSP